MNLALFTGVQWCQLTIIIHFLLVNKYEYAQNHKSEIPSSSVDADQNQNNGSEFVDEGLPVNI